MIQFQYVGKSYDDHNCVVQGFSPHCWRGKISLFFGRKNIRKKVAKSISRTQFDVHLPFFWILHRNLWEEWGKRKRLNWKALAHRIKRKLLANVFEDYLFSFLFSHFTIFAYACVGFVCEWGSQKDNSPKESSFEELIKIGFHMFCIKSQSYTHHASSNFISFIKFIRGK